MFLYNREAQAGASQFARMGLVDRVKPFEDRVEVLRGNLDAFVGSLDAHGIFHEFIQFGDTLALRPASFKIL